MPPSDTVQQLIDDLSSDHDSRRLEATLLHTRLLLEQSWLHLDARSVVRDEELRRDVPPDYEQRRFREIEAAYRELHERGLFPKDYLGLVLTDEELDAITGVLLGLLDRMPPISVWAAAALSRSRRWYVVPKLADIARQHAIIDGNLAGTAINAIGDILRSIDPRRSLTPAEERIVTDAVDALRLSAEAGMGDQVGAREVANQELLSISSHLHRAL
jgi:hypothetical protein